MKKRYYNASTLEAELHEYEAQYGISTETLLAAYDADVLLEGMSGFDMFSWAATSRTLDRMRREAQHP